MANQYKNEVVYNGQTLISLKEDTITPSKVLSGETFHDRSGAPQTGSMITHNVYDGLDSSSTDDALSANMGKQLNSNLAKTSGSGTASNQYGSASFSYNVRANICSVSVEYTPNINISSSSGIIQLSDLPSPSINVVSPTYTESQLASTFGVAVIDSFKACRFLGPRTAGVMYNATFTYVVA